MFSVYSPSLISAGVSVGGSLGDNVNGSLPVTFAETVGFVVGNLLGSVVRIEVGVLDGDALGFVEGNLVGFIVGYLVTGEESEELSLSFMAGDAVNC